MQHFPQLTRDEPDNPIRVSVPERERALLAQGGRAASRLARLPLRRVFATAPGAYSPATEFGGEDGEALERCASCEAANSDRMSLAYGDGDDGLGDPASFSAQLKTVDSAVLSRTSSVYELLDTPWRPLTSAVSAWPSVWKRAKRSTHT